MPLKKRHVRHNQAPFMNKQLSKAIMKRSKLRNEFLRKTSKESKLAYNKQRNFCVNLLKKTKRDYFENLNPKSTIDNKNFWVKVKPYLTDKVYSENKITLIEGDTLVTSEQKVDNVFSKYYKNIIPSLNLKIPEALLSETQGIVDPISKAILKYKFHPSIKLINQNNHILNLFSLKEVNVEIIKKLLMI